MRNRIIKFEKKLTYILQMIGGIFIVAGTLLIFYSAVSRYLFSRSPMWTEEACRMLALACSFWLMGHMEFINGQVSLSILADAIKSEKIHKILQYIKFIIVTIIAFLMFYWGTLQFISVKGQKTYAQIYPKQLPASIIPIGAVILIIYCLMKLYLMITEKSEKPEDKE